MNLQVGTRCCHCQFAISVSWMIFWPWCSQSPKLLQEERNTLNDPMKTSGGYELHPHSMDGSIRFSVWQKWHHTKLGNKIQNCSSLITLHKPHSILSNTLFLSNCQNAKTSASLRATQNTDNIWTIQAPPLSFLPPRCCQAQSITKTTLSLEPTLELASQAIGQFCRAEEEGEKDSHLLCKQRKLQINQLMLQTC